MNDKEGKNPGQALIYNKRLRSQLILFTGMIIVYIIFNVILGGRLLTLVNLKIILSHTVFPALVAWGMSFFFSTGIIDLSIGANVILSANIGCLLATKYNFGMLGLIIGTIVSVVILEHLVIRCAVTLKIPSWIAGLGAALVYEAILALYITTNNIFALDLYEEYRILGNMPYMAFVYIIGFVLAYFLFNRTNIGLNIRAVGSNEKVAASMGIDKKKTIFIGALIGGVFIGLAAIVQISYSGRIYSQTGLGSLSTIFQALACVLLSGSISKIVSSPVGILISSFFIMSIFNILTLFGVPSGTGQNIFLGAIVITCGILSNLKNKGVVK